MMKRQWLFALVLCVFVLTGCEKSEVQQFERKTLDVTENNREALELYEDEKYEESLKLFNESMIDNPIDMEARLGIIKNYIALEQYYLANINLSAAYLLDPKEIQIYELYVDMSKKSENINWARTAVDLAKINKIDEFLETVPTAPQFSIEGGTYNERLNIEVTCDIADATVYVSEVKNSSWLYDGEYVAPFYLTSGETVLSAYCVVDGMPSEVTQMTYKCNYDPTPVTFKDPNFELLIREELNKPNGEIMDIDCENVFSICTYDLQNAFDSYEEYENVKINSLDDLVYFPNLTYIYIDNHQDINDLSPLAHCRSLNQITCYGCDVDSLDFLGDLPSISYLYLDDCGITDLSLVLACKNLNGLSIEGNPINDISELKSMENLYYLRISDHQVTDWDIFADWESIVSLGISGIEVVDFDSLSQMVWLTNLDIYRDWKDYDGYNYSEETYLNDISFVEPLENLQSLSISGLKDLSQIYRISALKNLTYLSLYSRYDYDSDVDATYIRELQKELPNCTINY